MGYKPTCVNCKFFDDMGDGEGQCFRMPPMIPVIVSSFDKPDRIQKRPVVSYKTRSCGEYRCEGVE